MDSLELQSSESVCFVDSFRLQAFITPLPPPERPEDANAQSYVWHEDALSHCSHNGTIFPYLHGWPERETDKGLEVTYHDHFVKDLELLPRNVKAAFWPDVIVWNTVDRLERTTRFVEDLRVFLRYMYPARAPGPPTVQIDKAESVDIVRLKCQDDVLLTFILLPANSLVPEDWEIDTLNESDKIAQKYVSFLKTLGNNSKGKHYAAFMDVKSSVVFRGYYDFVCAFESHPYFQVFALMSEMFSAKWDCSKYSNQTGPTCFPRTLVSGCARDPVTNAHIDLSRVLASSEHDLYEAQTGDRYFQHCFIDWHHRRMKDGERWLDSLTFPDTDIAIASVLSTTANPVVFLPLVLTVDDPTLLWFQNILFHATSSVRPTSPSFSALNVGDRIKLIRSIRSGPQLHGQTFLVGVEGEDSPFVLKIYDERLFPYPKWDMDREGVNRIRRWPDAEASMRKEENA
ncbi:hypothetical protein BT69DRAFT_1277051, partial [Atractiella rhizophila]